MKYQGLTAGLALTAGVQGATASKFRNSRSYGKLYSPCFHQIETSLYIFYLFLSSVCASIASIALLTSPTITAASNSSSFTPNGIKAGSAGGDAYPFWKDYLGWWYDWTPVPLQNYPDNTGTPIPVVMLWGDGTVSDQDSTRYQEFLNMTTTPQYILGYEEPDCSPPSSSDIASDTGAQVWNDVIAPWNASGSLLGSPSMCSMSNSSHAIFAFSRAN